MFEELTVERALPQVETVLLTGYNHHDYEDYAEAVVDWRDSVNDRLREIVASGDDVVDVQVSVLAGDMLLATIFYWAGDAESEQ